MAINQWDPLNLPIRPGLYTNFTEAAIAQIKGGLRGIVGMPIKTYTPANGALNVQVGKFYTVNSESQAKELFGAANIQSIKFILQAGAKEVLVYTLPSVEVDYDLVRDEYEARPFNVFVFDGEISEVEQDETVAWVKRNRTERKHFFFVTGGTTADDQDITVGNARSVKLGDDYAINLVSGVEINGVEYSSGEYAAYIAGLVAGTPINKSLTYTEVPVGDVTKRLRNSDIESAIKAGSLVLVSDGEKVKIEQGWTTGKTKIRAISSRQQIATDIEKTARDNYLGKLDNNEDGQASLISAIKLYLETLETNNVLILPKEGAVKLDDQHPSTGDKVFLSISYVEVDSMEQVFLSINV